MMLRSFKKSAIDNAKNILGWRTKRKIIVISVDDYGNVRLDSNQARQKLNEAGLQVNNRFDAYDTLETTKDLEMLFETLRSVKDSNGRHPVVTPFAVPCNINFEKISATGYRTYYYELLPDTFVKMSDRDAEHYAGAWQLWKQGISEGFMVPQFHGREHVNVKVFNEKLKSGDHELLACLQNRSFTSITDSGYQTISPMAAFDFWKFEENEQLHTVIVDGLTQFEKVFGYRADHFTPPVFNLHPVLYKTLKSSGIHFIDTALFDSQHQGEGRYKWEFNYTGKIKEGLCLMVRNVVFEPTDDRGIDWVSYAMQQIETAFRWNKPAIISSHRVNFCGYIDEKNREKGLSSLKELLNRIAERWPEVEYMAANEVGRLIAAPEGA